MVLHNVVLYEEAHLLDYTWDKFSLPEKFP